MANPLLEKLRKSRETLVEANGLQFTVRRLTDFDIGEITQNNESLNAKALCKRCVTDWPGMTELKLGIPGGTGAAVPFDSELFVEWLAEQKPVWEKLLSHIWEDYKRRAETLEDELKKAGTGLSQPDSKPVSQGLSSGSNPEA